MKISDATALGKAIRNRRKKLGYTQSDLAEFSGLSVSFISNLENGKPTCEIGKAIYVIQILGMNCILENRGEGNSSNKEKIIDLHTHSTCSDGSLTPAELARAAKRAGVSALALTDHDSVSGIEEIMRAGEECGLLIVPGVELSTDYDGEEIHVVGLFIDPDNEALRRELGTFVECRDNRNTQIIDKLAKAGFSITPEEVYKKNPDSVVARPHIARYLVETGQAKDVKTVFDRYIGAGGPCYVERYKISPTDAVRLVHEAGGLAILAHPCLYHLSRGELRGLIEEMKEAGLDGIEALYSRNEGSDETDFLQMAKDYGLLVSGGSDFHGASKPDIAIGTGRGDLAVPYEILTQMRS